MKLIGVTLIRLSMSRRPVLVGVIALALMFIAGWVYLAVNLYEATQWQAYPLDSVYTTSTQPGLKPVNRGFLVGPDNKPQYIEPYGKDLNEIWEDYLEREPKIFLVRARDINGAVKASWLALNNKMNLLVPAHCPEESRETSFWLVAYLGYSGSEPPTWLLETVKSKDHLFRVKYTEQNLVAQTADRHYYFFWVPLGKIESGSYKLELSKPESKRPLCSIT